MEKLRMKKYGLPSLILFTGLLYIFVIPAEPHGVKLLFKLIPMALIIAYAFFQIPTSSKRYHWVVLAGLFFCMMGDGLLGWFIIGLSAFLVGHLFYMTAFFGRWRFSLLRFATVLPIAAYAVFMSNRLVEALTNDGQTQFIIPVLVYVTVISLMAWSAIMSGNKLAIAGSLLFVVSDSVLSWNMFVSDVTYAGPIIMLTYYSAQYLIARSLQTAQKPTAAPATIAQ
jgi:uncharacterized membrane protein YhhN